MALKDFIQHYADPIGITDIIRFPNGQVKDIKVKAITAGIGGSHAITDPKYHKAAGELDRNKIVATNPLTGAIEYIAKSSIGIGGIQDNILHWDTNKYTPFPDKRLDSPSYPYFYLGDELPSNHWNVLNLDGKLQVSGLVSHYDDVTIIGDTDYTRLQAGGLILAKSNYTITPYNDHWLNIRPDQMCSMIEDNSNANDRCYPIYIGTIWDVADKHGEHIMIDDYNRLFDLNMTNIKLSKGTANKWLKLNASNIIEYVDTPGIGAETDPVFLASAAHGITSTQISHWDTAYSWGNHAGLYTPLDHKNTEDALNGLVKVDGKGKYSAVKDASDNWNTAYGWGNHALAGYLASSAISGTSNYIPKFTGANTLGNSILYTTGTRLALNGTGPTHMLELNYGHIRFNPIPGPILGAWTAALAGIGAGNVNIGTHYYYCKYVGEYGITGYESAEVSVTVVNNAIDGKVLLTNIPIAPTGQGVTARKLYRTQAGVRYTAYYLGTINDNTTTSYTDNTADVNLITTDTYYTSPNTTTGKIYRGTEVIFFVETYSTFVGYQAGKSVTTGGSNAFFGSGAGGNITTGGTNTFIGAGSVGTSISTGGYNTAVGGAALRGGNVSSNNSVLGASAFQPNNGTGNCGIGVSCGYSNTSGNYNLFLGFNAGYMQTGSNTLIIDTINRSGRTEATEKRDALIYGSFNYTASSQVLSLGGGGKVGIGTITPSTQFHITGQMTMDIATGTSPFAITSTTLNTNLNADMVDGLHSSAFAVSSHTHNLQAVCSAGNATSADIRANGFWAQNGSYSSGSGGYLSLNYAQAVLSCDGDGFSRIEVNYSQHRFVPNGEEYADNFYVMDPYAFYPNISDLTLGLSGNPWGNVFANQVSSAGPVLAGYGSYGAYMGNGGMLGGGATNEGGLYRMANDQMIAVAVEYNGNESFYYAGGYLRFDMAGTKLTLQGTINLGNGTPNRMLWLDNNKNVVYGDISVVFPGLTSEVIPMMGTNGKLANSLISQATGTIAISCDVAISTGEGTNALNFYNGPGGMNILNYNGEDHALTVLDSNGATILCGNVNFQAGTSGKWLALDANKNIQFMAAPLTISDQYWMRDSGTGVVSLKTSTDRLVLSSSASSATISSTGILAPGIHGSSTSSYGVVGYSANSSGVSGTSASAAGGSFVTQPNTTNDIREVVRLTRQITSGTVQAGLGGYISFYNQIISGAVYPSGYFVNKWTTITAGSETSVFEWWLRNAGGQPSKVMGLDGAGNLETLRGKYHYHRQSFGADSVGDWRFYSDANGFYIEYYDGSTWIVKQTVPR